MRKAIPLSHLKVEIVPHFYEQFDAMKKAIKMTEQNFKKEVKCLTARLKKELNKVPDEEKEYIEGWYDYDFIQIKEVFQNIQRRALFIMVMCRMEANLALVCKNCHDAFDLPITFEEFKDKYKKSKEKYKNRREINIALSYLQNNLQIRSKLVDLDWTIIQHYWIIRNALVHNHGRLKTRKDQETIKFVKDIPTMGLNPHNEIILHEGSVDLVLHKIIFFFERLLRLIAEKYKESQSAR
jgi:hypothetical protein